MEWLSPVVYLIQKISPNSTYETQWVTDRLGGQRYETSVLTSVTLENGWLIAAYAAAGAALPGTGVAAVPQNAAARAPEMWWPWAG